MKNKQQVKKYFTEETLAELPVTFADIQFVDVGNLKPRDFRKYYTSTFHSTSFALNELPSKPISKILNA